MSKITPPPAMTRAEIAPIATSLFGGAVRYPATEERFAEVIQAARDQQWLDMLAQQEPVVEYMGRRRTPEGTRECWGVLLCDDMQDPAKGTKLYTHPAPQQADRQRVPEGYALVPIRMSRAMEDVLETEGWQWEDLLAAAEAITVEQYDKIAAAPEAPAQASAVDERAEFEAWYSQNAFNFERDPIGSRECGLQWKAWQARAALARKGGK